MKGAGEYNVDSSFIDSYKKKSKQRGQDAKALGPERLIWRRSE
jgi:hypothetical protein